MLRIDEPEPETAREDGKIFVPGLGWMTPGVCTPGWCAEGTGGKCAAYGCRKEKQRKRRKRQA